MAEQEEGTTLAQIPPDAGAPNKDLLAEVNYLQRAAILMMSLGEEDSAKILQHLNPKEVQSIGMAMAEIQDIEGQQINLILDDFLGIIRDKTSLGLGSDDYIRNMLVNALGEEKASGLIDRILLDGSSQGLEALKWMDARAISELVRYEHPQIQSLVIAHLEADQAAEVLNSLPPEAQTDIVMRIAKIQSIQPEAIRELNDILEKQYSSSGSSPKQGIGGSKTVADIMNFLNNSEIDIMEQIQSLDEELAQEIQDLMFVFDNIVDIDDRGIQALLREVSTEHLMLALKGADEALKDKILSNMSKRAAQLLLDDLEAMPPVKLSEVEAAQKEVIAVARRMAETGEIVLGGAGGEEML